MRTRTTCLACPLIVFSYLVVGAGEAKAQVTIPINNLPVGTNIFNGAFNITKFVNQNGQLAAVGTLSGTVTNLLGTVLDTVKAPTGRPCSTSCRSSNRPTCTAVPTPPSPVGR